MALKLPRCPAKLPSLRRKPVELVIDLSGVEMIDAAGLGALISVALTAQASQCSVKLAAPGNLIRQLLELTKLTSVFELLSHLGCRHCRIPWTSGMTDPTRVTRAGLRAESDIIVRADQPPSHRRLRRNESVS